MAWNQRLFRFLFQNDFIENTIRIFCPNEFYELFNKICIILHFYSRAFQNDWYNLIIYKVIHKKKENNPIFGLFYRFFLLIIFQFFFQII